MIQLSFVNYILFRSDFILSFPCVKNLCELIGLGRLSHDRLSLPIFVSYGSEWKIRCPSVSEDL